MSTRERRQIFCSVSFHIIAVICVVWSLYVLIDRTAEEIKQGRENGKHDSFFHPNKGTFRYLRETISGLPQYMLVPMFLVAALIIIELTLKGLVTG